MNGVLKIYTHCADSFYLWSTRTDAAARWRRVPCRVSF